VYNSASAIYNTSTGETLNADFFATGEGNAAFRLADSRSSVWGASGEGEAAFRLSATYGAAIPAAFTVQGLSYDAYAPLSVSVMAEYAAAVPSRVHVMGLGVLGMYDARVPAKADVFDDAVPYGAEMPAVFDCTDWANYAREYGVSVPASFNCTGDYAVSVPSKFLCLDGSVRQQSNYA
jgi:hypothetical protein